MTTWEEIRDEVAGMLADGQPLEDVIGKLEKRKNETAKPMTNEEWLQTATTEQLAEYLASTFDLCGAGCHHCFLANVCLTKAKNGNCLTQEQMIVEWLKQPHKDAK